MIWLLAAAPTPSSTRNALDIDRTGTPRAAATSESTDANRSGRAISPSTARAAPEKTASRRTWSVVMPRKLPNSSVLMPLRLPRYRDTKRNPQANAKACTVPMAADSSLNCCWPDRGSAAITSAAAMQKA